MTHEQLAKDAYAILCDLALYATPEEKLDALNRLDRKMRAAGIFRPVEQPGTIGARLAEMNEER